MAVDPTPNFSQVLASFPTSAPQAWMSVQAQLNAEGAGIEDINRAKEQFGSQLSALASGFQSDIGQAAKGAAEYVQAGFTVSGAVMNVVGLVDGASKEPPAQLVQTSVGVLVGILVATGAATAGVGAAITGVVAVLTMVLSKAGLFGEAPSGTEICPGVTVSPKPDWVVGCIPMWSPSHDGKPVTAAMMQTSGATAVNPLWMRFPRKDRAKDKYWFLPNNAFLKPDDPKAQFNRNIDVAFPPFAWIERDDAKPDPRIGDFLKAYSTAWRINGERALNGQKPSTDAEVLYHTNLAWNNAHSSLGTGDVMLKQQALPGWVRIAPPPAGAPYVASLIASMQAGGLTDNFGPDGQSLRIHMGARKTAASPKIVALHLKGLQAAGIPQTVHVVALTLRGAAMTSAVAAQAAQVPSPQNTVLPLHQLFGVAPATGLKRWLPYLPAAMGVVLFPVVGVVAPLAGSALSALWWEIEKS